MIYLKIEGLKAIGKARPRFNFVTKRTYTPEATKKYEERVRNEFWKKYTLNDCFLEEPLQCKIRVYYKIPKSYTKKKRAECIGKHYMHKPDCDNIAKAILDALNLYAYKDDIQIVKLDVEKFYTEEEDYVEVEIDKL
jgi:Holliday junction resolvase RusA-like endonuclease